MERRDWKELLKDRTIRILIPYVFGIAILGPVFSFALPYLGWQADYTLEFGHLWFLLNIYLYVVWLLGDHDLSERSPGQLPVPFPVKTHPPAVGALSASTPAHG